MSESEVKVEIVDAESVRPAALEQEGRRARAIATREAAHHARVDAVDAAVGPMTPVEQIRLGLHLAHRGVVQGRAELERVEAEARQLRSDLVDGEERLRTMASDAVRARRPRHAMALEGGRSLKPLVDGRPSFVVTSPVDEATQASLAVMGLLPTRRSVEPQPAGLLDRILSRGLPWGALRRT